MSFSTMKIGTRLGADFARVLLLIEIKALIGNSVEKVNVGTKLVGQAGATMDEIVNSIKRVTDIMDEITLASREQTAGIEQINQAIGQMDQVTQLNAALVEEAAAAAETLQDQAGNLAQVVSIFKMDGSQAPAAPVVRKASVTPLVKKRPLVVREKDAGLIPAPAATRQIANSRSADDGWNEF